MPIGPPTLRLARDPRPKIRDRTCGNCDHGLRHPTVADHCWCVVEPPRLGLRIVENKEFPELEGQRLAEWPLVAIEFRCAAWKPTVRSS